MPDRGPLKWEPNTEWQTQVAATEEELQEKINRLKPFGWEVIDQGWLPPEPREDAHWEARLKRRKPQS